MAETGLTSRQYEILAKVKEVLPPPFLGEWATEEELDRKILAYAQLVVDDINYVAPITGYTLAQFPPGLDTILILGINAYTMLFMQMKWTMNDFSYTDNGLSLSLDRVEKLDKSYQRFYDLYMQKTENIKNNLALGARQSIGTPFYGSMLGNFFRVAFGSSQ